MTLLQWLGQATSRQPTIDLTLNGGRDAFDAGGTLGTNTAPTGVSDVRTGAPPAFTESADAEDVIALLRDYHAAIGEIIIKYNRHARTWRRHHKFFLCKKDMIEREYIPNWPRDDERFKSPKAFTSEYGWELAANCGAKRRPTGATIIYSSRCIIRSRPLAFPRPTSPGRSAVSFAISRMFVSCSAP